MKCQFIKPDGQKCQAHAVKGDEFCYFHNPNISNEEKKETQTQGGQARGLRVKEPLEKIPIKKIPDVALLLVDTINRVRDGTLDIRVANCLGFLSDKLMRALEVSDLEERFDKLEQLVGEKANKY
jgi:hypothetical protein